MLETRREIFRTSVVAALGLSFGALAGFAISQRAFTTTLAVVPLAGSIIAVWGENTNGQYSWYFFVFDSTDASKCQLWISPSPYPSSTPPSRINVVDTSSWYASLSSKSQITQSMTLQYTRKDSSSGTISVTITPNGYLDSNSLSGLLQLMADTNSYTQTAASWNEIGKKSN